MRARSRQCALGALLQPPGAGLTGHRGCRGLSPSLLTWAARRAARSLLEVSPRPHAQWPHAQKMCPACSLPRVPYPHPAVPCQPGAARVVTVPHATSLCPGSFASGSGTGGLARSGHGGLRSCWLPEEAEHPSLCVPAVPSASMTRLARSRTASLTSASSVDGTRPRACTHSESSEAMGQVNHTMEVSC